ncbi:MAG: hypothetical protein HC938_03785 [Nitrospira sp.]|nr:hypothetical protein [Nitrospira sp.]
MMQREGDHVELVLADGMLSVPTHGIQHPVLLQRLNLDFDPALPEFRLTVGTEPVGLHRALLRLVPSIEARMIAHFDKDLEQQPVEPLGGKSTTGFFRRLVQGLFTDGEFLEGKGHGAAPTQPSIWREPLIFLRPRTAGLNTTLDYILEDLNNPARRCLKDYHALSVWRLRICQQVVMARTHQPWPGRNPTCFSTSRPTRNNMTSQRG